MPSIPFISAVSVNNANLTPIWDKRFVCVKETPVYFILVVFFFFVTIVLDWVEGEVPPKKPKKNRFENIYINEL